VKTFHAIRHNLTKGRRFVITSEGEKGQQEKRRITIDLFASAARELDKMKEASGLQASDLFRYAFSLLRIYVQAKGKGQEVRLIDPKDNSVQTRVEFPMDLAVNNHGGQVGK